MRVQTYRMNRHANAAAPMAPMKQAMEHIVVGMKMARSTIPRIIIFALAVQMDMSAKIMVLSAAISTVQE